MRVPGGAEHPAGMECDSTELRNTRHGASADCAEEAPYKTTICSVPVRFRLQDMRHLDNENR